MCAHAVCPAPDPILDAIPVMLIDEAERLDEAAAAELMKNAPAKS